MTATAFLFLFLLLWVLAGALCSFVMARRGHDAWSWGALGTVFGPLVIPLTLAATRRERVTAETERTVHTGHPGPGPVDLLVGIDGSPESRGAALRAVSLLGERLGRCVLATVLDFDAAELGEHSVFETDAEALLAEVAATLPVTDPGRVVLAGRPAEALSAHAREGGFDLIAVGHRGKGLSRAVLGSVASHLLHLVPDGGIPVLIGGGPSR